MNNVKKKGLSPDSSWMLLPEFVDLNRLIRLIPESWAEVFSFLSDTRLVTGIVFRELQRQFTIVEEDGVRCLHGMDGLTVMGKSALTCFLHLYWRLVLKDFLGIAGYHLEAERAGENDSGYLIIFHRKGGNDE